MWRPRTGDAYNASLSLTTVPAALHSLTGVSGLALFKVAYPAIFALFPVSVAVLLLRFVGRVSTLGLTILVAMNPIGFWQISAVARQELALVLFAALLLAVMVSGGSRAARTGFVLIVGCACVLAHYSTGYVAIGLLGGAVVLGRILTRRASSESRERLVSP